MSSHSSLRIVYAIQNVGLDFLHPVGNAILILSTLYGLLNAGHQVSVIRLQGQEVHLLENIRKPDLVRAIGAGMASWWIYRRLEGALRRVQRLLRIPYFALFDSLRFYLACRRAFAGCQLVHEYYGLFGFGAALACRRLGLPYVLTFDADPIVESDFAGQPLAALPRLWATWMAKFALRTAAKVLCVSTPTKKVLIERWRVAEDKIAVLPNGVDTTLFQPRRDVASLRQSFRLNSYPTICFVGGFQPWHGLDVFIAEFWRILERIPDARLVLVGDGRARPAIDEQIERSGVKSRVIITGYVDQETVARWLACADVAILPYPRLPGELWFSPLKLYEYMAAGKAIVAVRDGQIAEVIEDRVTGILVEPGDMAAFAEAVVRLLLDPELGGTLGENARRQAEQRHSWGRSSGSLEEIYRSVV